MKRSKFTDTQIMDALKRVDAGLAAPEVCRELGISTPNSKQYLDSPNRMQYFPKLFMNHSNDNKSAPTCTAAKELQT